jgi:hypothetical protein
MGGRGRTGFGATGGSGRGLILIGLLPLGSLSSAGLRMSRSKALLITRWGSRI